MRTLLIVLLACCAALAGCASSSDDSDGSGAGQTGTVGFAVTDAPTDEFSKVEVTISRVAIHRSAGDGGSSSANTTSSFSGVVTTGNGTTFSTTSTSSAAGNGTNSTSSTSGTSGGGSEAGWITIVSEARTVDLLALHRNNTAETLGFADVPAGHYQQVRFYVDQVVGTRTDGTQVNMTVPSGMARTSGSFTVTAGGNTTITVDIDLDRSIDCRQDRCTFRPHLGRIEASDD